ncbi:MAG: bifunctional 3-(3-hydroxy-phenyl)propionate/3-hydroxycinnamic acid hydroxylase [Pseudomonadota bacterium]
MSADETTQDNHQPLYDVAILGLGPVGCLAAILLARAGLSVVAVEQDTTVYKLPRAVNLDAEIVRALQPCGLAEAVDALLQTVRPGERVGFANSKREFLFGTRVADFGANGWQPMNMFDQPELEGFLREHALADPRVASYVGYRATAVTQDADTAQLSIEPVDDDNPAVESVRARYLLACDGASSFVRRSLQIDWVNLGYDHDWLVVDVTTKPGHTLELSTLQVCDPARITTYVCTKDPYRRWEFKLNPGETWEEMLQPERISSLLDAWTPRDTYSIRRAAVYQFHAATAATWRDRRIFIAGDAAHQTPPFLGQGMNSGMRDVINLAWKLPLVLRGLASPDLLDTYQAERDAHAHDLVDWAVSLGQLMEHMAAVEAAEQQGRQPPTTRPELQAAGYGQGRDQPPLRQGVVIEEQVHNDGTTGFLFSQPIVRRRDASTAQTDMSLSDAAQPDSEQRLDTLLGDSFCLVGKTAEAITLSEYNHAVLARLGGRVISLQELEEVRGHFDRVFAHADAALVRPDRCIFGHTDEQHSADDLVHLLADKLCLQGLD